MRDQKTKAQTEKKLCDNTHPVSPQPHPDNNQPSPTYSIPASFIITIR